MTAVPHDLLLAQKGANARAGATQFRAITGIVALFLRQDTLVSQCHSSPRSIYGHR